MTPLGVVLNRAMRALPTQRPLPTLERPPLSDSSGRRDAAIATRVQRADEQRLLALTEMFARHGFHDAEALVRARLLYHSQVGYYAARTSEPTETRLAYVPHYLQAMTGTEATTEELAHFEAFLLSTQSR